MAEDYNLITADKIDDRCISERGGAGIIARAVLPIIANEGFDLVRVALRQGKIRKVQIMVERPDGSLSIEDCESVLNLLRVMPESDSKLRQDDEIEISSPGVERPLVRVRDFEAAIGSRVRFILDRPIDNAKRLNATIDDISDGGLLVTKFLDRATRREMQRKLKNKSQNLEPEKQPSFKIRFDNIESAQLLLTEEQFRELLNSQGDIQ